MKRVAILVLVAALGLTAIGLAACGSDADKLNAAGNEAYAAGDYPVALGQYNQALAEDPALAEPLYNTANVYYRQREYEQSSRTVQTAMLNADLELTQHGYFNLGNALYQTTDYSGAVAAYQEALRLDPGDMDAKINLELALQKLQEQQTQEQDDQQDQDQQDQDQQQDQQDQQQQDPQGGQGDENQAENSDQSDQQQEQQSGDSQQDQSDQQPDQQPGENQQEPSDQQPGDQGDQAQPDQAQPNGQDSQEQPDPFGAPNQEEQPSPKQAGSGRPIEIQGLTEEQARQLLVAASQDTQTLQEYLQQMYVFPYADVDQDW